MAAKAKRQQREVWMRVRNPELLKRRRARLGLTQRELAFLARCSQTTIYLLEKGSMTTLSDDLAIAIAKRLQSDVEDFFEERSATVVPKVSTDNMVSRPARTRGVA